jgi:hypothetical protein
MRNDATQLTIREIQVFQHYTAVHGSSCQNTPVYNLVGIEIVTDFVLA